MRRLILPGFAASLLALIASGAGAQAPALSFNRIGTFHVLDNLPRDGDPAKETSAEIIAATPDGMTLVYTDSPGKRIGLIDIADPAAPKPAGLVALNGEPTSLVVIGGRALVGVVTSEDFARPAGEIAVVDLATRAVVATCDLGGQPDSVAKSPDGAFLAVAIENERDEKKNDGALPQSPPGNLTILRLVAGGVDCASKRVVDLTGLAAIAPDDPEPEFVDVNSRNEAVVTLQENNHIVIVDLATGRIVRHFSAGTVDLGRIDVKRDGVIDLSGEMRNALREPDAVKWIDDDRFVVANEGDWKGGARGFTIFRKDGGVDFESGPSPEHMAVRLGHYPEHRDKKGIEMEGAEVATFGSERLLFLGAERGSLTFVYRDRGAGSAPDYLQALPGGIGPEGLLALPGRNLFVTASETDRRKSGGAGSVVTLYRREAGAPAYPTIASADDANGLPIPWTALSGLAADPATPGRLHAVMDSAWSQGRILTIDASATPARIVAATTVTRDGKPAAGLDLEGIAARPQGGFWIVSEGNPERKERPTANLLLRVSAAGAIEEEIAPPPALAGGATRFGFEGVTVAGSDADETVWIAVQREWKDDPAGQAKLLAYRPADRSWRAVRYPLDAAPQGGWVGLSEITAAAGGLILLERDNQIGPLAKIKKLTFVSLAGVTPAPLGGALPLLAKTTLRDLLPDLAAPRGYVIEKIESFAIDAAGMGFAVTDNDGVDGSSGETQFLRLGPVAIPR